MLAAVACGVVMYTRLFLDCFLGTCTNTPHGVLDGMIPCGLLELGDTPGKDACAYTLQSHKQQLLKGRHNGQQTNNFLRTMIYVCAATYVNSPVHAPCHLLQCFFVSPTCIQNILTYADTCSLLIM